MEGPSFGGSTGSARGVVPRPPSGAFYLDGPVPVNDVPTMGDVIGAQHRLGERLMVLGQRAEALADRLRGSANTAEGVGSPPAPEGMIGEAVASLNSILRHVSRLEYAVSRIEEVVA